MNETTVQRTEGGLGWSFFLSVLGHGMIIGLAFFGAKLFPGLSLGGSHPGGAGMGTITAKLVSSVPGGTIPMPSPVNVETKNRLANSNPGQTVSEPRHVQKPPENAIALPARRRPKEVDLAKLEAQRELDQLARADQRKEDDNRVKYGNGGQASFTFSTAGQGVGGGGGMQFGDAAFGSMYGEYVNQLRDRLSYYWNQEYRDPSLPSGRPVFISFTVDRSGSIGNIAFAQRSNYPTLDSRAYHAVQVMASSEKLPLPQGYPRSTLDVRVSFELQ